MRLCVLLSFAALAQAQSAARLVELHPPVFPPLANQARIDGIVEVKVTIRPDGSIDSVMKVSGHPLLAQTALDSAAKSRFECPRCTGPIDHTLTYSFVAGMW